jgi:hypothetical protein
MHHLRREARRHRSADDDLRTRRAKAGFLFQLAQRRSLDAFAVLALVADDAGGGVDHEDITVHVVPLAQIDDWLARKTREGLLVEPRIYAALYFVQRDAAKVNTP